MKRLVGLAVSLLILWLLWRRIDARALWAAARGCDPAWLAAGLSMVVPLTVATAWRFRVLGRGAVGFGTAVRLILSSSTLNLVLPSKMGDIAKAWVLSGRHAVPPGLAVAVVVLEKLLDLASLLAWGVLALLWVGAGTPLLLVVTLAVAGLLALLVLLILPLALAPRLMAALGGLVPGKAGAAARGFAGEWREVTGWFWSDGKRAAAVLAMSLGLWAGHLAQFWLFAHALGARIPFIDNMAAATLSILVGLAPFTMAGVGTRDAAIVVLYRAWLTSGQGAVLGVLATMRYLMPAVAGLPYLRDYLPPDRRVAR